MDKIIAEIIISALALSLLFISIPLYKNNQQLITNMAGKVDYCEKIKEVIAPKITDNNTVDGSQVVSVIRYYAEEGGVLIKVITDRGTNEYKSNTYDESLFKIDYNKSFFTKCVYLNNSITSITYTQLN